MKTGQGFLLVFSITSQSSLVELAGLREEILRIKDDQNVPMVIVGNKADLEETRVIPRAKGFAISQRWGAPYYEASARTRSKFLHPPGPSLLPHFSQTATNLTLIKTANVDEVFIDLCRQMLRKEDEAVELDESTKSDSKNSSKRRRKSRFREGSSARCAIL